jgi:hypothetical protein
VLSSDPHEAGASTKPDGVSEGNWIQTDPEVERVHA